MRIEKTLVMLFGNVDLDFIYYRTCCKRGIFDIENHFTRCISAYNDFLTSLLDEAGASGKPTRICILAPQLTPIRDSVFIEVTARNANVTEDELRAMAEKIDVTHAARLARTRAFNARLEREIIPHEHIRVFRIDGDMMDGSGALHERFYPPNVKDHHANEHETFKCWRAALSNDLSIYQRFRPDAPPRALAS